MATQVSASTLRERVRGEVLDASSEAYDQARRVWNGTVDRRPGAIVYAEDAGDVAATIRYARETGADLAVRCGGHSMPGLSTCDDGVLLDLSRMGGVEVDAAARIARVGGGARLGDIDRATVLLDLATPTGTVSHTGVAGLALNGGLGRLMRKHGAMVDNVLAVDLVTADGEQIRVSEDHEPDLFWGIRGAGPNFGVVTRFEFALHPHNQTSWASLAVHPLEAAHDVLGFYADFASSAPDPLVAIASVQTLEPGGPYPPELIGQQAITLAASYCGDSEEEAEAATAEHRAFGKPLHTMFVGMPYLFFQSMMDEAYTSGIRFYDKGGYVNDLSAGLIDEMLERYSSAPHGAGLSLFGLGGAFARVPEDAMAFSGRSSRFFFGLELGWQDPSEDEQRVGWGRTAMRAFDPYLAEGNYVNALDGTEPDNVRKAYGDEKYERLVELKTRWDPDNVFRLNQNITPRA